MKFQNCKNFGLKLIFVLSLICLIAKISYTGALANNDINIKQAKPAIPIAMSLDDGYTYPTIVSMTSIMENASETISYDFYIMHAPKFSKQNKEKIMSLIKKYRRCKIKFINMGQEYNKANDKGHITTPAYYRLSLPEKLPNIDKIIYLDGDTLVSKGKNLQKMYDLKVDNLYCRGFLDDNRDRLKKFGINCDKYICSGVMLMNLKSMRKDKIVQKFKEFISKNNDRLNQHDQTVINYVCRGKIGELPPGYGMFNYSEQEEGWVKCFTHSYSAEELKRAFHNRTLIHYVCKPWWHPNAAYAKEWFSYAKKTGFFDEICKKYPDIGRVKSEL